MSALFPSDQSAAATVFGIALRDYPPSTAVPSTVVAAQTHAVDEWFDSRDHAGAKTVDINVPTLIADGTVDRLDPVANDHRLASLISKARLMLFSDAGHAFLFQKETTFVPAVETFLNAS